MSSLFFSPASFFLPQFFLLFYLIPSHFNSHPRCLSQLFFSHLISCPFVCFSSFCPFLSFKPPQKTEPLFTMEWVIPLSVCGQQLWITYLSAGTQFKLKVFELAKRGLSGPLDSRTPSMNLNRSVQWKLKEKWAKSWGWVGMFSWMRHSGHFRVKNVDLILKMCFILSGSEVANHYAQLCNHFCFFRGFEYTLCAVLELWCSLSTIIAVNLCFL